jgi:hypothetical protein
VTEVWAVAGLHFIQASKMRWNGSREGNVRLTVHGEMECATADCQKHSPQSSTSHKKPCISDKSVAA